VGLSTSEFNPKPGGCVINDSSSLVMLLDTVVDDSPHMACKISSKQGIMIPMWIAGCDTGTDLQQLPRFTGTLDQKITKCAMAVYNLGNIKSDVTVDGHPVAKLDVRLSLISGSLNYKINSPLTNITDFSSKGFDLTIPPDSHEANEKPGTWRAGSQGWWVFLKPLPPGEHTIFYNVRVTPTGPLTSPGTTTHFADITYKLQVT
jgi:hypothetical protein